LYKRVEHATPRFPELVQVLWAEINLLLDRRISLELSPTARDAA
jgi:hypothetical protein